MLKLLKPICLSSFVFCIPTSAYAESYTVSDLWAIFIQKCGWYISDPSIINDPASFTPQNWEWTALDTETKQYFEYSSTSTSKKVNLSIVERSSLGVNEFYCALYGWDLKLGSEVQVSDKFEKHLIENGLAVRRGTTKVIDHEQISRSLSDSYPTQTSIISDVTLYEKELPVYISISSGGSINIEVFSSSR